MCTLRETVRLTPPLKDIIEEIHEEMCQDRRQIKAICDDIDAVGVKIGKMSARMDDLEKKFFELISGDAEELSEHPYRPTNFCCFAVPIRVFQSLPKPPNAHSEE